ncbi:MAG: PEP-CTERM sorting domain-containing protein [Verrucomicrobia bacterium]|nr:PEP-CTERM sorting domain-containing protein [Verrucomicrobiota bacterium]
MNLFRTILMSLLMGCTHSSAQGTLEFTVTLDGNHSLPANASVWKGTGTFTFSSALLFQGDVFVQADSGQGGVSIYSSPASDALGAVVFTLSPGPFEAPGPSGEPGGRVFFANRTLSANERTDLLGGNWWAVYSVAGSPESQLRGQIQVVPEPSAWALMVLGGGLLASLKRRKKRG